MSNMSQIYPPSLQLCCLQHFQSHGDFASPYCCFEHLRSHVYPYIKDGMSPPFFVSDPFVSFPYINKGYTPCLEHTEDDNQSESCIERIEHIDQSESCIQRIEHIQHIEDIEHTHKDNENNDTIIKTENDWNYVTNRKNKKLKEISNISNVSNVVILYNENNKDNNEDNISNTIENENTIEELCEENSPKKNKKKRRSKKSNEKNDHDFLDEILKNKNTKKEYENKEDVEDIHNLDNIDTKDISREYAVHIYWTMFNDIELLARKSQRKIEEIVLDCVSHSFFVEIVQCAFGSGWTKDKMINQITKTLSFIRSLPTNLVHTLQRDLQMERVRFFYEKIEKQDMLEELKVNYRIVLKEIYGELWKSKIEEIVEVWIGMPLAKRKELTRLTWLAEMDRASHMLVDQGVDPQKVFEDLNSVEVYRLMYLLFIDRNEKLTMDEHNQMMRQYMCKTMKPKNMCGNCFKIGDTGGRCKCNIIFYCSKECQISNWKLHRRFCVSSRK